MNFALKPLQAFANLVSHHSLTQDGEAFLDKNWPGGLDSWSIFATDVPGKPSNVPGNTRVPRVVVQQYDKYKGLKSTFGGHTAAAILQLNSNSKSPGPQAYAVMMSQPDASGDAGKITLYDFAGKALATATWADGGLLSWGKANP
jgi:hypothetical protein